MSATAPLPSLPLLDLIRQLAARSPAPGGGAAAAVAAAIGVATGAMAARYTTGRAWGERSILAEALAAELDAAAARLLSLAEEDAAAYARLVAARRGADAAVIAHAEGLALDVPLQLIASCAQLAERLRTFLGWCNPLLASDGKVAIHLLAGGARAAYQTLLANQPDLARQEQAARDLARVAACETDLLLGARPPSGMGVPDGGA
jgi:formiminotetrahydrofolate cyclodeaminase